MTYEVYSYTLPKIAADGRSIPGPASERSEFANADDALNFATARKESFDRVVLMEGGDDGQRVIARFQNGKKD